MVKFWRFRGHKTTPLHCTNKGEILRDEGNVGLVPLSNFNFIDSIVLVCGPKTIIVEIVPITVMKLQ